MKWNTKAAKLVLAVCEEMSVAAAQSCEESK